MNLISDAYSCYSSSRTSPCLSWSIWDVPLFLFIIMPFPIAVLFHDVLWILFLILPLPPQRKNNPVFKLVYFGFLSVFVHYYPLFNCCAFSGCVMDLISDATSCHRSAGTGRWLSLYIGDPSLFFVQLLCFFMMCSESYFWCNQLRPQRGHKPVAKPV